MAVFRTLSARTRPPHAPRRVLANKFAYWILLLLAGCAGPRPLESSPPVPPEPSAPPAPLAALRVGTSGDYAPFSVTTPPGIAEAGATPPSGFSIDVARAFAAAQARDVTWTPFLWARLEARLRDGDFDLALSGVTVRADRSVAGRFSVPLTVSGLVVLVPEAAPLRDADDLDRPAVSLAVNAGGHLERTARRLFPTARIVPIGRNGNVLGALDRPAIDAVVTDSLEAPHWQGRRAGLRAIGPLTRDRKAGWFPTSARELRRDFDRWVLRAEASGALARLRTAHGLPPDRTATPVAALLGSLDERLSLMPAVAAAKQILERPVEDRPRETRVLAAARTAVEAEARRQGVAAPEADAVLALYRAQIEAAKAIQRAWLLRTPRDARDEGGTTPAATSEGARQNLETKLRPALIDLGDRIAWLLVVAHAQQAPAPDRAVVAEALARHALPPASITAIHAGLEAVLDD